MQVELCRVEMAEVSVDENGVPTSEPMVRIDVPGPNSATIPWRRMLHTEFVAYDLLLGSKCDATEYTGLVPKRVADEIEVARASCHFKEILIWSEALHEVKDPIVVGYVGSRYDNRAHIIARWGAELIEMPELFKRVENIVKAIVINITSKRN